MNVLLLDTGVLFAMFDEQDSYHDDAISLSDVFDVASLIIPWPIMYETLRTKFVRKTHCLQEFEQFLIKYRPVKLCDSEYRETALSECLEQSIRKNRPLSLADCLVREVIVDNTVQIDALGTFNVKDFHDVCFGRDVEIISN